MSIVFCFVGPPGSGKGYNSTRLYDKYKNYVDLERFSVGDHLRKTNKADSSGNLSSIQEVTAIIDHFLSKNRKFYIIDGYPRSIEQAKILVDKLNSGDIEKLLLISLIISNEGIIISRLSERHNCRPCGISFAKDGKNSCPSCGAGSYIREDDASENAIKKRIDIYNSSYNQVKSYFIENGVEVLEFDGSLQKDLIYQDIVKKIEPFFKK